MNDLKQSRLGLVSNGYPAFFDLTLSPFITEAFERYFIGQRLLSTHLYVSLAAYFSPAPFTLPLSSLLGLATHFTLLTITSCLQAHNAKFSPLLFRLSPLKEVTFQPSPLVGFRLADTILVPPLRGGMGDRVMKPK